MTLAGVNRTYRTIFGWWAAVIALFVIALGMRAIPIGSALPYSDYVDEGHVLHQALTVVNSRSLDTKWYGYPSFPAYLVSAAMIAYAPVYQRVHGRTIWNDLSPGEHLTHDSAAAYDLISPYDWAAPGGDPTKGSSCERSCSGVRRSERCSDADARYSSIEGDQRTP